MSDVYRTTRCFSASTARNPNCLGQFPNGFLKWCREMGWWGEKRCYLCAGAVADQDATTVDVRPQVSPTLLEDARKTSLPDESFDWVMLDPPYSRDLARDLYDTEDSYAGINAFTKEASRIAKSGGLILTLTYEIPKRLPGCDFIAVCGVYSIPATSYMRCFTVSRKRGEKE